MTLQAVIFDVDGTLADTEEVHRQAFNATFREFGLPWHWDEELYIELLAIAGGKERLRHYCRCVDPARLSAPDAETFIAGLHEHKTQAYNRHVAKGEVLARPGVIRLISELREAGVRLAIEDSKNGVRAALGADIPVLVTESSWTCRDDFTGAVTVLPNLGGVDVAALRRWHEGASRCRP